MSIDGVSVISTVESSLSLAVSSELAVAVFVLTPRSAAEVAVTVTAMEMVHSSPGFSVVAGTSRSMFATPS